MKNNLLLADFVAEIFAEPNLEIRFKILVKFANQLGFESISYTCVPAFHFYLIKNLSPVFFSSELFSTSFLDEYLTRGLHSDDFTIRLMKEERVTHSLDWAEYAHNPKLTVAEVDTIQLAFNAHKIANAFTIPLMSGDAGIAGASVLSSEKTHSYLWLRDHNLKTLELMCKLFHSVCYTDGKVPQTFLKPFLEMLSEKEIAVIKQIGRGRPLKNIEYDAGVAQHYASNVLDSLRKKLGGITKNEFLYLVGVTNILEYLD